MKTETDIPPGSAPSHAECVPSHLASVLSCFPCFRGGAWLVRGPVELVVSTELAEAWSMTFDRLTRIIPY